MNAVPGERFGLAVRDLSATPITVTATHTATAGAPLPQQAIDFESKNVFVNGPGPLIGDIAYTIGSNHSYVFAAGDVELGVAVTPEHSSTLSIIALGTLGAASTLKHKLKSFKPTKVEV